MHDGFQSGTHGDGVVRLPNDFKSWSDLGTALTTGGKTPTTIVHKEETYRSKFFKSRFQKARFFALFQNVQIFLSLIIDQEF